MAWISVITDEKNSLTKHFKLGDDGKLLKSAPGHLVKGSIESFDVNAIELIDLIKGLNQNQCLCLGTLATPEKQTITCGKLAEAGGATRSKDSLSFFPGSSFLPFDFDDSGKTPQQALDILAEIDPQLKNCAAAVVPSSSSYIYTDEGREIVGEGNFHIFIELQGDRDPAEYGRIIFDRLLLSGYAVPYITKAGSIVVKSLFDHVVLSPERELFSADPVCDKPLLSKRLQHVSWQEGGPVDSDAIEPLNGDEQLSLRLLYKEIREGLQEKAAKVRKEYQKEVAKTRAKANNSTASRELADIPEIPILYDKQGRPIIELLSNELIMGEDGILFKVRELLIAPEHGTKLPDPVEPFKRGDERRGIPGKGVATVLGNMIYSHSHFGVIYLLRWDANDLIDFMDTGDTEDKKFVWKSLSTGKQELSSATTDADISQIADVVKKNLSIHRDARVGQEKKHLVAKLKPGLTPDTAEVDKVLEMNAKYGVVNMGGKAVIVSERWNAAIKGFEIEFSLPTSLDTLTKNIPMRIPGKFEPVSLYRYWEQHPERRTYDGITFEPNAHTFREEKRPRALPSGEEYNMFQGYIYSPSKASSCDLILNHIKEVWCSGIKEEYDYVLGWLAHLFQFPGKLSGTALVMQSVPGAGKGIIIENCIVKPMGVHGMSTSNMDDLTGRFNLHLGFNIFFYANEIAYTAKNEVKSLLKTLVETESRNIEAKNVNKVPARNCSSVIFSANGDWMLNIEADDRRFVYLTVSSHKVGDLDYFIRLKKQIDEGGKDAFIKYLLNYDLSDYVFNRIPNRKHKQRTADFLRSTHPIVKFVWSLFDTDNGVAHYAADPMYQALKSWQEKGDVDLVLHKPQFFSLYIAYCEYYKIERRYDDPTAISMQLEVGGILRRETDPSKTFIMERAKKGDKEVYVMCSVKDGKDRLIV